MKFITGLSWIHRWLGIFLCFTLISISLTGTLLIWKKEYLWLSLADARQTINQDSEQLANAIESITNNYADQQILLIQTYSEGLALHKVFLDEGRRAWHNQQGQLIDTWQNNGRIEDWLLDLHHRFLLGNTIGLNIAGFSGLLLLPLLTLGLISWWPRRRTLKLGVIPKTVKKGSLRISHGNLGFLNLIPVLLIAITGIILTYPNESREWLLDPFSNDEDYILSEGPVDSFTGPEHSSWQRVLERAVAQYPDSTIRWVTTESDFTPYRIVGLEQNDAWNRSGKTTIYIDAQAGYMDVNIDALKRPALERLYDFVYPLHTAKMGLWYRLLLTLAGLALLTMAMLGLFAFFKRR